MLVNYHQTQTPLTSIVGKGTIFGRDRGGVLMVPVEVDYVAWTERASYFAHRPDLVAQKRSIWLSGRMSPLAKKNFESLGWKINEKTQL
jgi:hypothetical protein